jgi:hypothetical protein
MAFHVNDRTTEEAVGWLARRENKTLTETIRGAVEHKYRRARAQIPLIDRLRPNQAQFTAVSNPGGQSADKAFFDDLSGDSWCFSTPRR